MSDRARFWRGAALVLGLGWVPVWTWFRGDWLLKTSDIRLPVTWSEWAQFRYLWNDQLAAGAAALFDRSLILFHGVTAVASRVIADLPVLQKLQVAIWFPLAGLAMYALVVHLVRGPARIAAGVAAAGVYLYNVWQEHLWLGMKPPLMTSYAILPLVLLWAIQAMAGQRSRRQAACWIVLVSLPISAMGNNPSEAIAIAGVMVLCMLVGIARSRAMGQPISSNLAFAAGTLLAWTVVHSFWWLPQAAAVSASMQDPQALAGHRAVAWHWLEGTSAHTSLANVLRLQADWTWRDGMVDPYRTYAAALLRHPGWLTLSWLTPTMALYGAVRSRRSHAPLFIGLSVLGVVLATGVHPPFRLLYRWAFDHLPLFWAVRSPYYKFGLWICLGYAFLVGQAIAVWAARHPERWTKSGTALVIAFLGAQLLYAYPLVTGRLFSDASERTFLPPDRIRIPDYAYEAAGWLEQQSAPGRVFTIPGDSPWVTDWGYAGFGSVLGDLTTRPVVYPYDPAFTLVAQAAENKSRPLAKLVVQAINTEATESLGRLLGLLQVRYLVQQNDVRYNYYKPRNMVHDSPAFIRGVLRRQRDLPLVNTFGAWDVYEVLDPMAHMTAARRVAIVYGPVELALPLADTALLERPALVFAEQQIEAGAVDRLWQRGMVGAVVTDGRPLPAPAAERLRDGTLPLWVIAMVTPGVEYRLHVPRDGHWSCQGRLYTDTPSIPRSPMIRGRLDGSPWQMTPGASTTMTLNAGAHEIAMDAPNGTHVTLIFSQPGAQPWDPRFVPVIERRASPVAYDAAPSSMEPVVLMMAESAHAGWRLGSDAAGRPVTVNGYANGWVLEAPRGAYAIRFHPQAVVPLATTIAIVGVVALTGTLIWPRRRQP
ncbi:MAG: hypothetical protein HY600_02155 [Candidatus Omnitrophica bacterium]|nr:hypothetical protein [Candidatus Omnitrophota bacterium]